MRYALAALLRSNVLIASADAAAQATIDFQYYDHALDLECHGYTILALEELTKTAPLLVLIKPSSLCLPTTTSAYADSPDSLPSLDQAMEIRIKYSIANYHPGGTCAMLSGEPNVADKELRVYGTRSVRCADAIIILMILRGNIITTVYAVAVRVADVNLGRC
ncbi:hypothetical protein D0867_03207 [Hortaea werneckii]|uniref:Glucose-methanol-choline oxidoreductase C-terminal domain-containing protein n=1 Tax=Hortaea werneckii TaxID=91943 RepID=A0A3M7A2F2_HORWE|nr:hypothetical protein D0868_00198 [Hortaea werneckii]RMY21653.1 hypothetical protein D0867_03207 [Hortaea werneckii]RMY37513.1 hypothetical protein D0866_03217 [Hortaea werneckii]